MTDNKCTGPLFFVYQNMGSGNGGIFVILGKPNETVTGVNIIKQGVILVSIVINTDESEHNLLLIDNISVIL